MDSEGTLLLLFVCVRPDSVVINIVGALVMMEIVVAQSECVDPPDLV